MPKILFISRKWPPAVGGMENYSVELVAGLSTSADVETWVLPGRPDGRPPGLLAYVWFLLRVMTRMMISARRHDQVILGDLVLFPAAVLHRLIHPKAIRIVIVFGLDLVYHRRKGLLPFFYGIYFSAFLAAQGCFRHVVAISRYTADLARREGLRGLTVINPSLPDSLPTSDSPPPLPPAWSDFRDVSRILYFGRLIPRKGSLWFAQCVLPLLEDKVQFFIVGDSKDSAYKAELDACARTTRLGRLDSSVLAALIREADAVVMPNLSGLPDSDVEGFGLVAIETSASGGRLLAAAVDGITDAVIDGITGTLLPTADAATWASAISRLHEPSAFPERDAAAVATRIHFAREAQAAAFTQLLHGTDRFHNGLGRGGAT